MTQAELATVAQENIKVNVAIINNGYLGMVRQWQQFFHGSRYSSTPISSPDYVKLAEALPLMIGGPELIVVFGGMVSTVQR